MLVRIKNWAKYQHYRDRRPPWIKLHFQLLTSKDWACASDAERVLAIACMLIASQSDDPNGVFEADPEYFQRVAFLNQVPDFKPLIKRGFLEVLADASNVQAPATKCSSETEAYKQETETEKSKSAAKPAAIATLPEWLPLDAWNAFLDMRKRIKKPLTEHAVKLAINRLQELKAGGDDPRRVLEQSVLNCYQGLFEVRVSFADARAQENKRQASVGAYRPGPARERTPEELKQEEADRLEVERWEKLESGTLAVTSENTRWVIAKRDRLRSTKLPSADPRPRWFKAYLDRAGYVENPPPVKPAASQVSA
jgi:hypothetical protein